MLATVAGSSYEPAGSPAAAAGLAAAILLAVFSQGLPLIGGPGRRGPRLAALAPGGTSAAAPRFFRPAHGGRHGNAAARTVGSADGGAG